jgi:hypothetical protein
MLLTICRPQGPRGLRRGVAAACGFESRRRQGCLSLVSVVRCQVEVCVGLITRPTECGVSECEHEASIMRRLWPTGGCGASRGGEGVEEMYRFGLKVRVWLHSFWTSARDRCEWSAGRFTPGGKSLRYPLSGPESATGRFGKEKISCCWHIDITRFKPFCIGTTCRGTPVLKRRISLQPGKQTQLLLVRVVLNIVMKIQLIISLPEMDPQFSVRLSNHDS